MNRASSNSWRSKKSAELLLSIEKMELKCLSLLNEMRNRNPSSEVIVSQLQKSLQKRFEIEPEEDFEKILRIASLATHLKTKLESCVIALQPAKEDVEGKKSFVQESEITLIKKEAQFKNHFDHIPNEISQELNEKKKAELKKAWQTWEQKKVKIERGIKNLKEEIRQAKDEIEILTSPTTSIASAKEQAVLLEDITDWQQKFNEVIHGLADGSACDSPDSSAEDSPSPLKQMILSDLRTKLYSLIVLENTNTSRLKTKGKGELPPLVVSQNDIAARAKELTLPRSAIVELLRINPTVKLRSLQEHFNENASCEQNAVRKILSENPACADVFERQQSLYATCFQAAAGIRSSVHSLLLKSQKKQVPGYQYNEKHLGIMYHVIKSYDHRKDLYRLERLACQECLRYFICCYQRFEEIPRLLTRFSEYRNYTYSLEERKRKIVDELLRQTLTQAKGKRGGSTTCFHPDITEKEYKEEIHPFINGILHSLANSLPDVITTVEVEEVLVRCTE